MFKSNKIQGTDKIADVKGMENKIRALSNLKSQLQSSQKMHVRLVFIRLEMVGGWRVDEKTQTAAESTPLLVASVNLLCSIV
jgi:hypothetical protein